MNEYIKEIVERWGFTTDGHVITAVIVLLSLIVMLSVFWLILHIVSPKSSHYREMCFKVVIVTTAVLLCITTFTAVGGNVIIKEGGNSFSGATYIGTINAPYSYDDYGSTIGFGGYNGIKFGRSDVVILDIDGSVYAYTPYNENGIWYLNYASNPPFRSTLIANGDFLELDYITLWSYYKEDSIKVYTMEPNQILGVLGRGGE